jgi:hypothetical protein
VTPEYPVAAATALLLAALNSPNFNLQNPGASPSPSWAILQNGLAYFFGLVLSGGTIIGPDYIFNTQGLVFYNGTPAAGNVTISVTGATFTDQFGNTINGPGIVAYNTTGGGFAALLSGTAPALVLEPPDTATMAIAPQLQGFANNAGTGSEQLAASLFSGQETIGVANSFVHVFSEANDGSTLAQGIAGISGISVLQWSLAGVLVSTGSGGMTGRPDFTQTDTTVDTNANLTGASPATKQWSIPAGDSQVGTTYLIESAFNLVTGTTLESIGFKPSLNGAAVTTSNGDTIGATAMVASTGYTGKVRCKLVVQSIGNSGTANIFIEGGMSVQGNLQGTVDDWFLSSQATGVAFSTLNNNTIAIDSIWGGNPVGSAQSVANHGSEFTRKGP